MLILTYWGCKPSTRYYEQKDKEITIKVGLEGKPTDTGGITLKVKILPEAAMLAKLNGRYKNDFYYHMDSCFYLVTGKQKTYASLVVPIANGVSSNYEYLLTFEDRIRETDPLDLIYQDRYINKKTYKIKLN